MVDPDSEFLSQIFDVDFLTSMRDPRVVDHPFCTATVTLVL